MESQKLLENCRFYEVFEEGKEEAIGQAGQEKQFKMTGDLQVAEKNRIARAKVTGKNICELRTERQSGTSP